MSAEFEIIPILYSDWYSTGFSKYMVSEETQKLYRERTGKELHDWLPAIREDPELIRIFQELGDKRAVGTDGHLKIKYVIKGYYSIFGEEGYESVGFRKTVSLATIRKIVERGDGTMAEIKEMFEKADRAEKAWENLMSSGPPPN